jgi:hypothetical protein
MGFHKRVAGSLSHRNPPELLAGCANASTEEHYPFDFISAPDIHYLHQTGYRILLSEYVKCQI